MRAILCACRPCAPGWPWPGEGNQQPQIARSGLTSGNDGELVVDLHFHRVHTLLYGGHLLHGFHAELGQGVNRLAICDSTRPPSSITREETLLSSLSNWAERCFLAWCLLSRNGR